uniref:malate synthase n=1 Tax=Oryzias latipes TaxID=8090 RepID=A0A3P9M067_ORYLA
KTTTIFSITVPETMELSPAPPGLHAEYAELFSTDCLYFLGELISTFDEDVDQILQLRASRKVQLDLSGDLPNFLESTAHIRADTSWGVLPVPPRLQKRHVDVGDTAPCDTQRFIRALQSTAQGIQVPLFTCVKNQGHPHHVPHISEAPVLMLRPRAWNMVEHNMMVGGKEVPGPLFDFGLLMFHCGMTLLQNQSGPFFYLSKVESFLEARLWNKIFLWTQQKLGLPAGSIKATVLIENVLAAFEMDEILFELREHSAGLNCGIWDYSASFVNKFGHRRTFLLPDRSKYVNMEKHFLRSYMDLLVKTCHQRGALATGGMAAALLPQDLLSGPHKDVLAAVRRLKLLEIHAGVDGFMVYDLNLVGPMQELFQIHTEGKNQLHVLREDVCVTAEDLLCMPAGGVTLYGLKHNISVGILFINAWLSEVRWKTLPHRVVNRRLVKELIQELQVELSAVCHSVRSKQRLNTAADMFLEVVLQRNFPEFLTSYLNQDHTFLSWQSTELESALQRSKL